MAEFQDIRAHTPNRAIDIDAEQDYFARAPKSFVECNTTTIAFLLDD
jgi:hypothetical protein